MKGKERKGKERKGNERKGKERKAMEKYVHTDIRRYVFFTFGFRNLRNTLRKSNISAKANRMHVIPTLIGAV